MARKITMPEFAEDEVQHIKAGLQSRDAFTLKRSQILYALHLGRTPPETARQLYCSKQTVYNIIEAFREKRLLCLTAASHRPHSNTSYIDDQQLERLHHLLQQNPRDHGFPTSHWTLEMLSETCLKQGITERKVSGELIRRALKRLGVSWKRSSAWISSQDPTYGVKKTTEHD